LPSLKTSYLKDINIDGNNADWQNVGVTESPSKTFEYALAHNDDNLYLLMKITNSVEQMKFLYGGLQLWIDPTGEKKQTTEVIFPSKGELPQGSFQAQGGSDDKKQARELMHLNARASLVTMNRIGFKPQYSGIQTISQVTGFKASFNWNEANELIYELQIPLKAFPVALSKEKMDVEFVLGPLELPSNGNGEGTAGTPQRGGMSGGMHGGGGGMHGG